MCTHVPGEIVAFGPMQKLNSALDEGGFSNVQRIPLHPEAPGIESDERFAGQAIYRVRGVRHGHEVAAVSRLSALLGAAVVKGAAMVELNHRLPLAADSFESLRLSGQARKWADAISQEFLGCLQVQGAVAVIDSGINPSALATSRPLESYDYSDARRPQFVFPTITMRRNMGRSSPRCWMSHCHRASSSSLPNSETTKRT